MTSTGNMRQKLGQHFLINTNVPPRIARAVGAGDGEVIIEIGPGHGELTRALRASFTGTLVCIERDPILGAQIIRSVAHTEKTILVDGDVREVLASVVSQYVLPTQSYYLVGNIPYYLTGHLLRQIGELPHRPTKTVLMVQREVAERMAALPPRMNRLAATVQYWSEPRIILTLKAADFRPAPEVASAVICLTSRTESLAPAEAYMRAVRFIFQQPRKTLGNNLSSGIGREAAHLLLTSLSIPPDARPHDLAVEDVARIACALPTHVDGG